MYSRNKFSEGNITLSWIGLLYSEGILYSVDTVVVESLNNWGEWGGIGGTAVRGSRCPNVPRHHFLSLAASINSRYCTRADKFYFTLILQSAVYNTVQSSLGLARVVSPLLPPFLSHHLSRDNSTTFSVFAFLA